MKKRTVSILLAAMIALSMTACGNSKDQEEQMNVTTQESEEQETQETANQAGTSVQSSSNISG